MGSIKVTKMIPLYWSIRSNRSSSIVCRADSTLPINFKLKWKVPETNDRYDNDNDGTDDDDDNADVQFQSPNFELFTKQARISISFYFVLLFWPGFATSYSYLGVIKPLWLDQLEPRYRVMAARMVFIYPQQKQGGCKNGIMTGSPTRSGCNYADIFGLVFPPWLNFSPQKWSTLFLS